MDKDKFLTNIMMNMGRKADPWETTLTRGIYTKVFFKKGVFKNFLKTNGKTPASESLFK